MVTTKKAKFRVGQIVMAPHDSLKHKVRSKFQNRFGYWHYYITGLSGDFSESDLRKPTKNELYGFESKGRKIGRRVLVKSKIESSRSKRKKIVSLHPKSHCD